MKRSIYSSEKLPELIITTVSDFHGQLEHTYALADNGSLQEMGGIARLATALRELKKLYPEKVLLLGSGDYFVEDFKKGKYFDAFGSQSIAYFLNHLPIDASTIGNHEFDFGTKSADKTLCDCTFSLVASNLKQSDLSCILHKKLVVNKNGYKIGILGLMHDDIKGYGFIHDLPKDQPMPLTFEPNLYAFTQLAVNELIEQENVDFVVVLSHLGLEGDKLLAASVNGIDIICGGHSHEATRTGEEIVIEKAQGQTIIVHAGYKGMHLGVLKLWPKKDGRLNYTWRLDSLDKRVEKNSKYEARLQDLKKRIPASDLVAISSFFIDVTKEGLRKKENGFANFVTDVIRNYFDADVALINASSIRGGAILPPGAITKSDLDNMFPFRNNLLIKIKTRGINIRQALELGVADYAGESRALLHAAGLRYRVDVSKTAMITQKDEAGKITGIEQAGNRVMSVEVLQKDNTYLSLNDNQEYEIVVNSMMVHTSLSLGPFFMLRANSSFEDTGLTEKDVLTKYFKNHKKFAPNTVDRLNIIGQD